MFYLFEILVNFWLRYPALFYGMAFLLGFLVWACPMTLLFLPFFVFYFPFLFCKKFKHLILNVLCMILFYVYLSLAYIFPLLPKEGAEGTLYLKIDALTLHRSFFHSQWMFKCEIEDFVALKTDAIKGKHIKCLVLVPDRSDLQRPLANRHYIVKGILRKNEQEKYIVKLTKDQGWHPIKHSFSFAEIRYGAKKWVKTWIENAFSSKKSGTFLAGLATGEFDDRRMQQEFGRFGLQHIMAISGFHFAIIAAILNLFLGFLFSKKRAVFFTVTLLTAYFFFLGCSPSILRSWVMICFTLVGLCLERQSQSLNSLGIALIAVLFVDPLLCTTLGFQFSFLTTASILLFYQPAETFLHSIIPKRKLSQVIEMNAWNRHAYAVSALLRESLALTLAVNLFAFPLTLFYFHAFPVMGLFYNLFFPFLVSISLFLLILGLFFDFLFYPLGPVIHFLNNQYTEWVLNLTYHLPHSLDTYIRVERCPLWLMIMYISLVFPTVIFLRQSMKNRPEGSYSLFSCIFS